MLELDESEKGLDLTKDEGIAYAYDWIRMQKRKKRGAKEKLKKLEKRLKNSERLGKESSQKIIGFILLLSPKGYRYYFWVNLRACD